MEIQVRRTSSPRPASSLLDRVLAAAAIGLVIGLTAGRRAPEAPASLPTGAPPSEIAPVSSYVTVSHEPFARSEPAPAAPAAEAKLRPLPAALPAYQEPSGFDLLETASGPRVGDSGPSELESLAAPAAAWRSLSPMAAGGGSAAPTRGSAASLDMAGKERAPVARGATIVRAAASVHRTAPERRPRFTAAQATAAEAPRASIPMPTLDEMTSSIFADAAVMAQAAPPITADPNASFAMGGLTNLAVAPGLPSIPASGSSGSGGSSSGSGGSSSGSSGGAPGAAPAAASLPADSAPAEPARLPVPGPSPIPWRAGPSDTGMIFPDISIWRVPKDWDALNAASHGIVVMKVRQASVDRAFNKSLAEAEKRKMIVIGYAFGYGIDGAAQADALLLNFQPKPGRILMLDLEHNPYGSTMTEAQAIAFVERIHARTGRYPMLYTSASRRRPGVLAKCPRYVAQWGGRPADADVWQFTNGVVGPAPHSFPGVGSCDINKLMTPYATLRRWAGLDRTLASAR